jgi:hypothetical protein
VQAVGKLTLFDLIFAVVWVVVTVLFVVGIRTASAHSWYPPACCSDRDCWPAENTTPGEPLPVETVYGWLLHDGTWIARGEEQASPDGRFHVCRQGGDPAGAVIRIGRKACFFAPQPAM